MSKNVISMLGAVVVGVVLVGSATQGCGGSSSDPASVCSTACTKAVSCSMGTVTMSACVSDCEAQTKDSSGQSCSNSDAILSAYQKCGDMTDCTAAETCAATTIPKCAGASGTAGAGGTTSAGTTCDTACKKADDCTKAIDAIAGHADAAAATGSLQASCDAAGPTDQATLVMSCNSYLTTFAPLLGAQEPAVCK